MKELVSIIIPTYNRSKLLLRALESLKAQTYDNIEIIVIDDDGSDDTEFVVHNCLEGYRKFKYLKNKTNRGANYSRNRGVLASKGKFITGLDDDDVFLPNRVDVLVKNYNENYSFITSDDIIVNKRYKKKLRKPKEITLDMILSKNYVGNQVLTEKKKILDVGLYDEDLVAAQDWDLFIRLIKKFGPGKSVRQATQKVFKDQSIKRISDRASIGYKMLYDKYKNMLTEKNKRYQKYNYYKASGEFSISSWFKMVPKEELVNEIPFLLKKIVKI